MGDTFKISLEMKMKMIIQKKITEIFQFRFR